MYFWGGYGVIGSNPAALETATWVWDPATDLWTDTGQALKAPGGFLWTGYSSTATRAFQAGGYDLSFVPQKATQSYAVATGWTACPNLPVARGGVGEGNVMGHLVVWGGTDGSIMYNKSYGSVTTGCGAWAPLGAFNIPVAKAFMAFGSGTSIYSAGGYDAAFNALTSSEHLP
jgi:hypothetical protein